MRSGQFANGLKLVRVSSKLPVIEHYPTYNDGKYAIL